MIVMIYENEATNEDERRANRVYQAKIKRDKIREGIQFHDGSDKLHYTVAVEAPNVVGNLGVVTRFVMETITKEFAGRVHTREQIVAKLEKRAMWRVVRQPGVFLSGFRL